MGERGSTALSLLSPRMIFTLFSYILNDFSPPSQSLEQAGQQQLYLPCSRLPMLSIKKRYCFCHTLNLLLAKLVWLRWHSDYFFSFFFLFLFLVTSTLSCCIKMHNKKEKKSQQIHVYMYSHFYQVILTSCLVNNVNLIVVYRQLVLLIFSLREK